MPAPGSEAPPVGQGARCSSADSARSKVIEPHSRRHPSTEVSIWNSRPRLIHLLSIFGLQGALATPDRREPEDHLASAARGRFTGSWSVAGQDRFGVDRDRSNDVPTWLVQCRPGAEASVQCRAYASQVLLRHAPACEYGNSTKLMDLPSGGLRVTLALPRSA